MNSTALWTPSNAFKYSSHLYAYKDWLFKTHNLQFKNYEELWIWSVNHIETFWKSMCDYFNVMFHSPYTTIMSSHEMLGTKWFEGATLNYAEHVFRNFIADKTALIF